LGEATIRYVFHPRYGESVVVVGRNRHGDEVALTIRHPDGSLAQLPIWMMEERAAAMTLTERPRLRLACLRELRRRQRPLNFGRMWALKIPHFNST